MVWGNLIYRLSLRLSQTHTIVSQWHASMNELSLTYHPRLPLPTMTGSFSIYKLLYLMRKPWSSTILCKRSHSPWHPLISPAVHYLQLPLSATQMESLNRWFTSASLMIGPCLWKLDTSSAPTEGRLLTRLFGSSHPESWSLSCPLLHMRLLWRTETYILGKSHTIGELFHSTLSGIQT